MNKIQKFRNVKNFTFASFDRKKQGSVKRANCDVPDTVVRIYFVRKQKLFLFKSG